MDIAFNYSLLIATGQLNTDSLPDITELLRQRDITNRMPMNKPVEVRESSVTIVTQVFPASQPEPEAHSA
jgi:hypothetical protein